MSGPAGPSGTVGRKARRQTPSRPPTAQPAPSVPIVDLQVVRCRPAFAGLDIRTQAEQECRPLHTAVRRELNSLAPVAMAEQHDRAAALLLQPERDIRADPLGRPVDATPADVRIRIAFVHFHHDPALHLTVVVPEQKLDPPTDAAVARSLLRP